MPSAQAYSIITIANFFWRGEMVRSMGGNYSIVSLHIIMQREWKGHSKDPRRQKSLSFQVLWF